MAAISIALRSIPYRYATKNVPVMRAMGEANLNSDTASGRTTPLTWDGSFSSRSAASSIAGSEANDDRVLKPTA